MPAWFVDPVAGAVDAWIPFDLRPGRDPSNADNHYLTVIGAPPSLDDAIAAAQAESTALTANIGQRISRRQDARARTRSAQGRHRRAVEPFARDHARGAVALVLLIVCVNVATLLLVRGSERSASSRCARRWEAGGRDWARQMFVEASSLALAGDAAGLLVGTSCDGGNRRRLGQGTHSARRNGLSLDLRACSGSPFARVVRLSALIFRCRCPRSAPGEDAIAGDDAARESRSSTGGREHADCDHGWWCRKSRWRSCS